MIAKKAKKRSCYSCRTRGLEPEMHSPPGSLKVSCRTPECMTILGLHLVKQKKVAEAKNKRIRIKKLKEKTETRTDLYNRLAKLVQQYCKHVVYKGEPCYTCDKPQRPGIDQGGAFHSGHFKAAKTVDPRRFLHDNIRIQCFACNKHRSGNQAEYRKRMEVEKGADFVEWLECEVNHKPLKEIFPHKDDIREECGRYRRMLKENGIRPCT